jgi:hypothetical protein
MYGTPYRYVATAKILSQGAVVYSLNHELPYVSKPASKPGEPTIYHGHDSFQIVSAGHDRKFGASNSQGAANSPVLWPLPPDCDPAHRDNIASFGNGRLGRGK